MIGLIIIVIIGILIAIPLLYSYFKEKSLFLPDNYNKNPYRRYCKKCGQQQILEQEDNRFGEPYYKWIPMYEIKDENCKCHKYTN